MSDAHRRRGPLLIVAQALPFQSSGTSIVLRRLLENFSPDEVVLLARNPNRYMRLESHPLHYPAIRIPSFPGGLRGDRYSRMVAVIPGIARGLLEIRRRRPSALMAVFPDETALLTGYLLHRMTRLPFFAYFCDLYMEDRPGGWDAALARWLQPRVFRSAARIIAVNDGMSAYYKDRYGVQAVCVPACINSEIPRAAAMPVPGTPFVVGYSGNINTTRLSSLHALVRAIGDNPAFAIQYFTPQKIEFLRSNGLWTRNSEAAFISDEDELIRRLSACDALFLPLTFEIGENSRDQLATCFGIKAYEYFLSQRPVVLQCPSDYFMARFYRDRDCGMTVDDPGPEALKAALERLRTDAALRKRLVENALAAARQFEGPRVAAILRAALPGGDSKETPA